jgi:5-methyltetrahydrofolate--homocysteine methyltransferase
VARNLPVPQPPFYGSQVVKGVALDDIVEWLDQRALFAASWGLRAGASGPDYDELVATAGQPRLRHWLDLVKTQQWAQPGIVYGYYPVWSDDCQLVLLDPQSAVDGDLDRELLRFHFPRQRRHPWLALPDYFRDRAEAAAQGPDVIALQLVTLGPAVTPAVNQLFQAGAYRDYLELHGLTVQLTEALAELWHHRVRHELNLPQPSDDIEQMIRHQAYTGARFSFGYPACPDLEQRAGLVELLDPGRLGVSLSEAYQLHPEQSTDAIIVHHREAHYFKV